MGLGSLTRIAGRAVTNARGNERRCRPGRLAGTPARTRERIAASCATGWISARTRRDHCALTSVILAASTAHAACTSTAPEPARFASLVSPRRRRQWFPQTRPRRGRRRARRRARRQARRRARRRARRLHQRRLQRRTRATMALTSATSPRVGFACPQRRRHPTALVTAAGVPPAIGRAQSLSHRSRITSARR